MSVLSMRSCVSNVKSVALTILKLLAFNPQKFRGHVTLTTPPFWKIFGGHVRIVLKNICTKLEDWNFNRFEAIVCFRLTDNTLHPWPRFGQELTYFTMWAELPILSFYLVYLARLFCCHTDWNIKWYQATLVIRFTQGSISTEEWKPIVSFGGTVLTQLGSRRVWPNKRLLLSVSTEQEHPVISLCFTRGFGYWLILVYKSSRHFHCNSSHCWYSESAKQAET